MGKQFMEKMARYKNRFLYLLLLLGGVCGAIGAYDYYARELQGYRLYLAVLFCVIKLYFFVPTIGLTEQYSVLYEIAKWLAPLGTFLGIVNLFGTILYRIGYLFRKMYARGYVVFGGGERAYELLCNLIQENNGIGYMISKEETAYSKEFLIRKGIKTIEMDLEKDPPGMLKGTARSILSRRAAVIFFEEEIQNFKNMGLFRKYFLKEYPDCPMVLLSRSPSLERMMEKSLDTKGKGDIRFFNLEKRMANQLMQSLCTGKDLLSFPKSAKGLSLDTLGEAVKPLHILILGFGDLGRAVFLEGLNSLVCNPVKNNRFTIADRDEAPLSRLEAEYYFLDQTAKMHLLSGDVLHKDFLPGIQEVQRHDPIDIVVFSLGDFSRNLMVMDRLKHVLQGAIAAIGCRDGETFSAFTGNFSGYYRDIIPFGMEEEVLNTACVLEDVQRKGAMEFNAGYNQFAARILSQTEPMESPQEQWNALSLLRKDSCISQWQHQNMKLRVLEGLLATAKEENPRKVLEKWEGKITRQPPETMWKQIAADPLMNYMAALEHRRWCNFYYLRNYTYSPKKDEAAQTHDCLIPDWAEFLQTDKRNTIVYDLLATLTIRGK